MTGAPRSSAGGRRTADRARARGTRAALGVLTVLAGALALVETTAGDAASRMGPALLAVGSWVTAAVVARHAGRLPGRSARPWRAFAVAAVLLGLGQAASTLAGVGVNTSETGWHDLPLVAAVPVALAACARLLPGAGSRPIGSRALLDGGIVIVAVALLGEALLADAAVRSTGAVDALVSVGYPAVGALLCGVALVTVAAVPDGRRRAAAWLLVSFVALAVVVVSGALAVTLRDNAFDVVTGVAWLAMLGAGLRAVDADPGRCPEDAEPSAGMPLPGVAVAMCAAFGVALFLTVGVAAGRSVSALEGAGITALMLLAFVRSLLWAVDGERLARRVRRTEHWLRALLSSGEAVTVLLDGDGRVVWTSGPVQDQLGWTGRNLAGRALAALLHAHDRELLDRVAAALRRGDQPADLPATVRLGTRAGDWRDVEVSGAARTGGEDDGLVLHLRDVSGRSSTQRELERLAYTDFLTGLPNRARFMAALAEPAGAAPGCILLIDLDGFKAVNDIAGHDAGDRLLCEVADRLRGAAREDDVVARLGGDEFAVLVRSGRADATALADRLVTLLDREHRPAAPDGSTGSGPVFAVSGSVGLAELRIGDDPADALRRADLALRAAKSAGKNCVRSSGAALDRLVDRRARLAADLPGAIAGGRLSLVYQPVVGVPDRRILGLEALVRWEHPELGAVPPDEFVGLAEDDGLVVALQRWVLRAATATLAPLLAAGHDLQLGVNISVRHLQAGCLAGDIAAALAASDVPPQRLMIELTESVLMGEGDMDGDLGALRGMGCVLSLDDFGKGYSTLARLARLPVDVLKMDRAFVAHIEDDPRTAVLVGTVVELGRTLGMDVVAEGVETAGQLAALQRLGCRYLQGFLLGAPVPAEELPAVLAGFDPAVLDHADVASHV